MSPEELVELARGADALMDGHFLLSSGLHTGTYFQSALLLSRPELATRLGAALASKIGSERVDVAVAPALGGILVAHEVARALGIRAIFAERERGKGHLTLRRGFAIQRGERAIVLEDVVTTGLSLGETLRVVKGCGGEVVAAGALVDRGGDQRHLDVPFFCLARLDVPTYPADDCPLCRSGSTPVKPGSRPTQGPSG